MAKKQSKKAKDKARAASSSGPLAALFNLDAGTSRGDLVRAVLLSQGIRVKTVTADALASPVGAIAGLAGFRYTSRPFDGEVPQPEFMLLCNVKGERLNTLLAAMREADAVVDCKAQVTQYNKLWPFGTLVAEVAREHEAMTAAAAATAAATDSAASATEED